jgi:hypothetical protein
MRGSPRDRDFDRRFDRDLNRRDRDFDRREPVFIPPQATEVRDPNFIPPTNY